jgi:class 3 adenylate cyclase/pimeloyl-ACP methyl ester carboxylesterase
MSEATRRLVAILFSDIAGYTAMMGRDEQRTVCALERSREIVRTHVEAHRGRILDEIGDGCLASFESALEAVECARSIQQAVSAEDDFDFRIGIHVGDVRMDGGRVIGDGVNVASRIHSLAPPGGICISDRVHDDIRNHPGIRTRSLGERRLKNVTRKLQVYLIDEGTPRKERRHRLVRRAIVLVGVVGAVIASVATDLHEDAMLAGMVKLPLLLGGEVEQQIAFATTPDGVRVAYATVGEGRPVISVLGWFTHIERGWDSPAYNADLKDRARRYRWVRYDGRGSGLSDRNVEDLSLEARVADLETVVDALGLERFVLWAISLGGPTAIVYTTRHPERVTHLVLSATFASPLALGEANPILHAMPDLLRRDWDGVGSRLIASLIAPEAPPVQKRFVRELLRVATPGETAARLIEIDADIDVTSLLSQIRVPTLVVHASGDLFVPFEVGGRALAAGIPGSELVVLDSNNHGFPSDDPETPRFWETFDAFLSKETE